MNNMVKKKIMLIVTGIVAAVVLGAVIGMVAGFMDRGSASMDFSGKINDAFTDVIYDGDDYYCYHIPEIDVDNSSLNELNERIYSNLYALYNERVANAILQTGSPAIAEMTYRYGSKGNVVSVVVQTDDAEEFYPYFYVYTVDAKKGKELSLKDICKLYDLSEDEFYEKVRTAVKTYSDREKTKYPLEMQEEFINNLIETTLSDEYIRRAVPFINSSGELSVIVSLFAPAENETYLHMISLESGLDSGYLNCNVEHEQIAEDAPEKNIMG